MREQTIADHKEAVEEEQLEAVVGENAGSKVCGTEHSAAMQRQVDVRASDEAEESCMHLAGRPCRLEMFDAEGKVCVLSNDGERRLCCQNLYAVWRKIDKDHEKMRETWQAMLNGRDERLKNNNKKKKKKKKKEEEEETAFADNPMVLPREPRNRDKVNLYVPITENPDRLTFYMDQAKQAQGLTIERALDSSLHRLKDLKELQQNCLEMEFAAFDFDDDAGIDLTVWSQDVIM